MNITPRLIYSVPTRRVAERLIKYQNSELPVLENYDGCVDERLASVRASFTERFEALPIENNPCYCCKTQPKTSATYCGPCKSDLNREVALLRVKHGQPPTIVCAVCGKNEHRKRLCLDHCHKTGRARGYICDQCNRAMSLLDNHPDEFHAWVANLPMRRLEGPTNSRNVQRSRLAAYYASR